MNVAGPTFAPNDIMKTADVDGDGQAEIIQITPNLGSSPVVNVWHFDAYANGPFVWRLQPQLRLTLTPSVGSNNTPLPPIVQFGGLLNGGGNQQLLFSMAIDVTPGRVYYTPFVYGVNSTQTGWTQIAQGPRTLGGGTFNNATPGTLQIGDVTGDGLNDIVFFEGVGTFLIFPGTVTIYNPFPGTGALPVPVPGFSSGIQAPLSIASFIPGEFALGDVLGTGHDQILTISNYPGGNDPITFTPLPSNLEALTFSATSGLQLAAKTDQGAHSGVLQAAVTGLNLANPKATSVLILNSDGLDEYAGPALQKISNTPFITPARFGDNASHYGTIQTGTVRSSNGAPQTILLARDAGGIHTLVPVAAGSIPNSNLAGFTLPQTQYFPAWPSRGRLEAYAAISMYVTGSSAAGADFRSLYTSPTASPLNISNKLDGFTCATTADYTQNDCSAVISELKAEIQAWTNAQSYYNVAQTTTSNIFSAEQLDVSSITDDLNLPSNAAPSANFSSLLVQIPLQAGYAALEFVGNAGIPVASQIAEVISVVQEILGDVEAAATPSQTSLASATLSVKDELRTWNCDTQTANANTYMKIATNWDIMQVLSQRIDANLIDVTAPEIVSAQQAAEKSFSVGVWQVLAPSAWNVYGLDNWNNLSAMSPLAGYPYLQGGNFTNSSQYQGCYIQPPVRDSHQVFISSYLVYLKQQSTPDQFFPQGSGPSPVAPVPVQAMQDLANLGVDFHDVLAGRNGWQIPPDLTDWCFSSPWTIPADVTPPPSTPPAPSGQLVLTVGGGVPAVPAQKTSCSANNTDYVVYSQQTPINSVFHQPLSVKVTTLATSAETATPVSGAKVQISGQGLSPATTTVVTDANGLASVPLLANGIVQGPYMAYVTLISPNTSGCPSSVPYELQNTPPAIGTVTSNPDMQAVVSVSNKTGPANDRLWTLTITDPTGEAINGGQVTAQLSHTRGPATCSPVAIGGNTTLLNAPKPGSPSGTFSSQLFYDFSSCTGLNTFNLTVSGTFYIPLNGGIYAASYSATTNNQTP
jgi:hypothetical protein